MCEGPEKAQIRWGSGRGSQGKSTLFYCAHGFLPWSLVHIIYLHVCMVSQSTVCTICIGQMRPSTTTKL